MFYFKGKLVDIINDQSTFYKPGGCVIVDRLDAATQQPCYPYQTIVPLDSVEPIVTDVYTIGDNVISTNGSNYLGVVIGFEPALNKVVTAPVGQVAPSMVHVRYSHSLNDIEHYTYDSAPLRPGKYYIINHGNVMLAAKQTNNLVMFITKKGEIAYMNVPVGASILELKAMGINSITQTTNKEWK